jgi:hypothetical protein
MFMDHNIDHIYVVLHISEFAAVSIIWSGTLSKNFLINNYNFESLSSQISFSYY